MNPQQTDAWSALNAKNLALFAYAQSLTAQKTAANEDTLQPCIDIAKLEMALVDSMMSQILNNAPIAFPDHDTLETIRNLAAALQLGVDQSADLNDLVAAGDALVKAWPTLNA